MASTSSWRRWLGLEDESPEVAMLVKAPFTGSAGEVQLGGPGVPSALSPQRWPAMDAAQEAMHLLEDEINEISMSSEVPSGCLSTDSLTAVLRRRSVLRMERQTRPQEAFLRILAACACVAQRQARGLGARDSLPR